jgi:hypothetical protein
MKTTKWMKAAMLALLYGTLAVTSATPGQASTIQTGSIDAGCSGSCMDVWKVECSNTQTHRVRAQVRDSAAAFVNIIVTTLGYTGPAYLIGQADPEVGNVNWSSGSDLVREGNTVGSTKAFVQISVEDPPYQSGYEAAFRCLNLNGSEVGNPVVTLLQNDHLQAAGLGLVLPQNQAADTYYCCGPNGCYPAPNNHPWNCGAAPWVVWCDDNGVCTPQ